MVGGGALTLTARNDPAAVTVEPTSEPATGSRGHEGVGVMASLFNKVVQFANSPKGKQVIRQATDKAQQMAKDPKTRAKLDDVRRRVQGGRGGTGTGTGPVR